MKRYDGIDYDFRPDTYWSAADPLALILGHVKGTNRRQMIRDYWEAGVLKALDDQLLQDTLTEAERCGGGDAAELRNFTRVESSFYPELSGHYEEVYDDWAEERDGAGADDEDWAEEHEGEDAGEEGEEDSEE